MQIQERCSQGTRGSQYPTDNNTQRIYLGALSWSRPLVFEHPQRSSLAAPLCQVGKQHPLLQAEGSADKPADKGDIQFQGKVIFPL